MKTTSDLNGHLSGIAETISLTGKPQMATVDGGSNVQPILEEDPKISPTPTTSHTTFNGIISSSSTDHQLIQGRRILCFSADDQQGIQRQVEQLLEYIKRHEDESVLDDLAYTLGQRRSKLKHKLAIQCNSMRGLQSSLESFQYKPAQIEGYRNLAFVFTGQGAQWPKMGRELLAYPAYKKVFQAADDHMIKLGAAWSLFGKPMFSFCRSFIMAKRIFRASADFSLSFARS